ncbi:ATP-binding protein [Spirulina major CS-329]|uniref:ATP-binding protein n=1 Tax=Spirulina TaxID=1154 RepID=UPI00232FD4B7|nr:MULTISPECIES: ATP-binding protein [Spirulina]MDB9494821.1 ATP-binding protein [Spirulina subsalsa CS-330]MDB9502926.1 ATP-binding protein [Spirulina major CS-329]
MTTDHHAWQRFNEQVLNYGIERLAQGLRGDGGAIAPWSPVAPLDRDVAASALGQLCQRFQLSGFERDIILLCAGLDLRSDWDVLCAQAQGNAQRNYPTFHLAWALSRASQWRSLTPESPLRRWRLIEIGESPALMHAPLRLDERILHYLMGVQYLDQRLSGLVEPTTGTGDQLVPSHGAIASRMIQQWEQASDPLPILQLWGTNDETKRAIAQAIAQAFQATLLILTAELLPKEGTALELLQCLIEREWQLNRTLMMLNLDYVETVPLGVARLIDVLNVPLILNTAIRHAQRHRTLITFEVEAPTHAEQHHLWSTILADGAIAPPRIDQLTSNFNLTPGQIQAAAIAWSAETTPDFPTLWNVCRRQSRPRLDELAQRLDAIARWEDLVLPEREHQTLQMITAQVRQRMQVYQHWGFGGPQQRGLGITALFAGPSGTGKTLAAEAIAATLNLDLYRIDLSSIISKYIGETEKNLRKLFDAAEGGGVILLFDEADALFGKRSEVKDSRDRHANVEVAYLLQRIEAFQGLAILTTNLKDSLDQAFLRRIRFMITFPFPKAQQRAAIWRKIFPEQTPTQNLNYELLAKLEVAGGNIKSIAMNAAFLAAEAGEPIQMKHLLTATQSEYLKTGTILTNTEIEDWLIAE